MNINGKLYPVVVGRKIINDFNNSIHIFSPINNIIIGSIPCIKKESQVRKIFSDAKEVSYEFRNTTFEYRKTRLVKFAQLLKQNWDELSNLLVLECAKSKFDSIQEIDRSVEYIYKTIEEYEIIKNKPLVLEQGNKKGLFIYEPHGVVLAISPFNYPINLLITKIAPALISGNVVVYKPATQGSCVGAYISNLLYEAGFNNGEVSCLIGKGSTIGHWVLDDKNIDMISFTGSTSVGTKIVEKQPLIPVVLEMGGKDVAIVLKDANLEKTAIEIVKGAFNYNGQRCTAIKRVLVDQSIKQQLISLIDKEVNNLKVGSAIEGHNEITEMIDIKSLKYNLDLLLDAYKNGAQTNQQIKRKGNILYPVVLYDVTRNCKIAWEEQFGPILPIMSFENIEEAIYIANESKYGLQSSIFTKDKELAFKIASALEVGTVNINKSSSRSPDIFPFIGIKSSGKGIQGIRESIISMNRLKGIVDNE